MIEVVKLAAKRAGGVPALATRIGVTRQALYQWRRVPADKVALLARETGLPERELRPDLYNASSDTPSTEYDRDFAAWAAEQAKLLKSGMYERLDIANLSEEIEDLAARHKDEIESRLAVLLKHLLKVRFQPEMRSPSWDSTILEQRARIGRRLARSPSLRDYPGAVLDQEYGLARREAALETGMALDRFPPECPFRIEDVLDLDFMPAPEGAAEG